MRTVSNTMIYLCWFQFQYICIQYIGDVYYDELLVLTLILIDHIYEGYNV